MSRPGDRLAIQSSMRGLIILGLALCLVLMISRILKQSNWGTVVIKGEGNCIYQVMRGKSSVGTMRFHGPANLSAIAHALDLSLPGDLSLSDPRIPCDSAIDFSDGDVHVRWEPLSASVLVALGGRIDLNTAQVEDLILVPGVGSKLAATIVDYRTKNGPFASITDLEKIPGIGEKKRSKMEPFLKIVIK